MPQFFKQHLMYVGGSLVVALIALAAYFISPELSFWKNGPERAAQSSTSVRTETFTETTDAYSIDLKYPQFDIPVIDAKIKAGVDAFVEEFKKVAVERKASEPAYELTSSFAGTYVDDEIVSTRLIVSRFTGGAHPGTMIYGLNYARATGKEIGLKSVLALIGATLQQVSDNSTQTLKEKLGDSFIAKGAKPTEENYWMYSINDKGVTFIFNEYQVAPYSEGPQRVSFARAEALSE
ncbi:MAG: DUF3298 and DUF4163 domain-containing protein [Minisyncoccia bacterium]